MEVREISPLSARVENASYAPENPPQEHERALQQYRRLVHEFVSLIQNNRRTLSQVIESGMHSYEQKTQEIKGKKDSQGWTGFELSLAGAALAALAPFIPSLNEASFDFNALFESLGGVDTVRKLLETSSQFTEGVKPVASTWSEAQILPKQTEKEFIQISFQLGQEAERQNRELVQRLYHLADEIYHSYSETRYG